jgi:rare lipoprotein A
MRKLKNYYVFCFIFTFITSLPLATLAQEEGATQEGIASWYGSKYHGKKTSSGEPYNKHALTAAHPTLPFNTKVKVTNTQNQKSVILRINDRGPFKGGRIIDVSEVAARQIGLVQAGTGPVLVEVLEIPQSPVLSTTELPVSAESTATVINSGEAYFVLQTGAYANPDNARQQLEKLKMLIGEDLPLILSEEMVNGKKIHKIAAGKFKDRTEADELKNKLAKKDINGVVRQIIAA